MKLLLTRPIAFFDLETTGINVASDRIVEIALIKLLPSGERKVYRRLVNPGIPIPQESSEIHGITDEMVANCPTFEQLAGEIKSFLMDCDLAGYNSNKFDVPLLVEEFLRTSVEFPLKGRKMVDVQTIFYKMEKRTLEAAYQFFCNKTLENAHSAEADVSATIDVLEAQLDRYDELKNEVSWLDEFSRFNKFADFAGRIAYDKAGNEVFNFGKHKGRKVSEVFEQEPGYYSWMMQGDFPGYTKKVLTEIKMRGK